MFKIMKRKMLLIVLCLYLSGCSIKNNNSTSIKNNSDTLLLSNIEYFCYNFFYKNINEKDTIMQNEFLNKKEEIRKENKLKKYNQIFKDTLEYLYRNSIIANHPVKLIGIKELDKKYYAQFNSENCDLSVSRYFKFSDGSGHFIANGNKYIKIIYTVIAEMSETAINKLDENKEYLLSGNFIRMLSDDDAKIFYDNEYSSELYNEWNNIKDKSITKINIEKDFWTTKTGKNEEILLPICGAILMNDVSFKIYNDSMYQQKYRIGDKKIVLNIKR